MTPIAPVASGMGVFSHINEYGDEHAAMLPELMAVSAPLTLWSPSTHLIEAATRKARRSGPRGEAMTQVLLDAIDRGHVVVMARAQWFREADREVLSSRFPPAAWNPRFDAQLASWRAHGHPHVIEAPEEKGRRRAERYAKRATRKADEIGRIVEEALVEPTRSPIPVGTLDRAATKVLRADKAIELLRDVYNHAQAFRDSQAQIEYFQPRYGLFLQYLGRELRRGDGADVADHRTATPSGTGRIDDSVTPLMAVLDLLERLGRDDKGALLTAFLERPEHLELARWTRSLADELGDRDAASLERSVARRLRHEIGDREPTPSFGKDGWLDLAGTISAVGALVDPVLNAIGLALASVSGLRTVHRVLLAAGVRKPNYQGPAWPFVYATGTAPTAKGIRKVWKELDRIEHRTAGRS